MSLPNQSKVAQSFRSMRMSSVTYYVFGAVMLIALLTVLSQMLEIRELRLHDGEWWKSFGSSKSSSTPEAAVVSDETSSAISSNHIPNIANFVFVLPPSKTDFSFLFYHFLAIYSVHYYWKPDVIYLHTNADEGAIERARNGTQGKWNERIFNMPGLQVNHYVPPAQSSRGRNITRPEHMSDFARVEAVIEFGGVYIDFDVFALRDVKPLRNAGFNAVIGRELWGKLNCGVFASRPQSKALKLFLEGMHDVFDPGNYAGHCVMPLTEIGERLVADQGEVLLVDREAFHPVGFNDEDAKNLFGTHNETKSNLEGLHQGDPLPEHKPAPYNKWAWIKTDKWDRKFFASYMLHGFHIESYKTTPRMALERQSVFSRAVYPVARAMYDEGLIELDDPL